MEEADRVDLAAVTVNIMDIKSLKIRNIGLRKKIIRGGVGGGQSATCLVQPAAFGPIPTRVVTQHARVAVVAVAALRQCRVNALQTRFASGLLSVLKQLLSLSSVSMMLPGQAKAVGYWANCLF